MGSQNIYKSHKSVRFMCHVPLTLWDVLGWFDSFSSTFCWSRLQVTHKCHDIHVLPAFYEHVYARVCDCMCRYTHIYIYIYIIYIYIYIHIYIIYIIYYIYVYVFIIFSSIYIYTHCMYIFTNYIVYIYIYKYHIVYIYTLMQTYCLSWIQWWAQIGMGTTFPGLVGGMRGILLGSQAVGKNRGFTMG